MLLLVPNKTSPIKVQTRAGSDIDVIHSTTVTGIFAMADKLQQKKHPLARARTQALSGYYNCHGLVFTCRRAAIEDNSQIQRILHEDAYTPIQAIDVMAGDIAIYYDLKTGEPVHSAIVVRVPNSVDPLQAFEVVSKWGNGREYCHMLNDCDYSTNARIDFFRVTK